MANETITHRNSTRWIAAVTATLYFGAGCTASIGEPPANERQSDALSLSGRLDVDATCTAPPPDARDATRDSTVAERVRLDADFELVFGAGDQLRRRGIESAVLVANVQRDLAEFKLFKLDVRLDLTDAHGDALGVVAGRIDPTVSEESDPTFFGGMLRGEPLGRAEALAIFEAAKLDLESRTADVTSARGSGVLTDEVAGVHQALSWSCAWWLVAIGITLLGILATSAVWALRCSGAGALGLVSCFIIELVHVGLDVALVAELHQFWCECVDPNASMCKC